MSLNVMKGHGMSFPITGLTLRKVIGGVGWVDGFVGGL